MSCSDAQLFVCFLWGFRTYYLALHPTESTLDSSLLPIFFPYEKWRQWEWQPYRFVVKIRWDNVYEALVQGLAHGELSVSPSFYYYYFLFSASCQVVKHLTSLSCTGSLHSPHFMVILLPGNPFCTLPLAVFFSPYYPNFLAWHSKPSTSLVPFQPLSLL